MELPPEVIDEVIVSYLSLDDLYQFSRANPERYPMLFREIDRLLRIGSEEPYHVAIDNRDLDLLSRILEHPEFMDGLTDDILRKALEEQWFAGLELLVDTEPDIYYSILDKWLWELGNQGKFIQWLLEDDEFFRSSIGYLDVDLYDEDDPVSYRMSNVEDIWKSLEGEDLIVIFEKMYTNRIQAERFIRRILDRLHREYVWTSDIKADSEWMFSHPQIIDNPELLGLRDIIRKIFNS